MKEYLFFQNHKKFLEKNTNSLSTSSLKSVDDTRSQSTFYKNYLDEMERKARPEKKTKRP